MRKTTVLTTVFFLIFLLCCDTGTEHNGFVKTKAYSKRIINDYLKIYCNGISPTNPYSVNAIHEIGLKFLLGQLSDYSSNNHQVYSHIKKDLNIDLESLRNAVSRRYLDYKASPANKEFTPDSYSHKLSFTVKIKDRLDKKNSRGNTPLMEACIAGNISRIKYLLAQGVDTEALNKKGKTSWQLFTTYIKDKKQIPEMARLFEDAKKVRHKMLTDELRHMYFALTFKKDKRITANMDITGDTGDFVINTVNQQKKILMLKMNKKFKRVGNVKGLLTDGNSQFNYVLSKADQVGNTNTYKIYFIIKSRNLLMGKDIDAFKYTLRPVFLMEENELLFFEFRSEKEECLADSEENIISKLLYKAITGVKGDIEVNMKKKISQQILIDESERTKMKQRSTKGKIVDENTSIRITRRVEKNIRKELVSSMKTGTVLLNSFVYFMEEKACRKGDFRTWGAIWRWKDMTTSGIKVDSLFNRFFSNKVIKKFQTNLFNSSAFTTTITRPFFRFTGAAVPIYLNKALTEINGNLKHAGAGIVDIEINNIKEEPMKTENIISAWNISFNLTGIKVFKTGKTISLARVLQVNYISPNDAARYIKNRLIEVLTDLEATHENY